MFAFRCTSPLSAVTCIIYYTIHPIAPPIIKVQVEVVVLRRSAASGGAKVIFPLGGFDFLHEKPNASAGVAVGLRPSRSWLQR